MLLQFRSMTLRKSASKLRYDATCKHFGEFSQTAPFPDLDAILPLSRSLPDAHHKEWERAVAEELLLCKNTGKDVPPEWFEAFKNVQPFDDVTIPLADVWKIPAACCMFPLATQQNKPGAGRVWVFKDGREPTFVTSIHKEGWIGQSYQLAENLARLALVDGNPNKISKLATDWIATGSCNGDRIDSVELGNKLDLDTSRNWIIPAVLTPPDTNPRGQIFRAANIKSAFGIVTGQGYQRVDKRNITQPVDVMHSFVSTARSPVLQVALATRPKKIVLWHSSEFKITARELSENLLPAFLAPETQIELRSVGSVDLARIETTIRPVIQADHNLRIVCNFTSGNLIQRLAFSAIVQSYPNMLLIYRDKDQAAQQLTTLSFETLPPTTCPDAVANIDDKAVNLDALVEYDPGNKDIAIEQLISKLKPENG